MRVAIKTQRPCPDFKEKQKQKHRANILTPLKKLIIVSHALKNPHIQTFHQNIKNSACIGMVGFLNFLGVLFLSFPQINIFSENSTISDMF